MSPYLFVPRAAFAHLDLSINRMICPYDLPYTWVLLNVLVGFTFLRAVHWLGLCEWPWDTLGDWVAPILTEGGDNAPAL